MKAHTQIKLLCDQNDFENAGQLMEGCLKLVDSLERMLIGAGCLDSDDKIGKFDGGDQVDVSGSWLCINDYKSLLYEISGEWRGDESVAALDDAMSQVKVLQKQLDAQISSLSTSTRALDKQTAAAEVQVSQLRDMLRKCHVTAPTKGTVLEKYVERGEFVSVGKPLFKVADTQDMYLRAYITSAQLQTVKLGQRVKVFADYGNQQKKEYEGTVTWISSRSEFTPKTILTDDERADLVYAVKIAVRNDGYIKIGMYGEVSFK